MKKQLIKISIVVCVGFLIISFIHPFTKRFIQLYVLRNQEDLFQYVQFVMNDSPPQPLKYNGWYVYYYQDDVVEFCTNSLGLVPSTTYKGFYYCKDDKPHGFQNVPVEFIKNQTGWLWTESDGDNIQYTEQITEHWYWYEAKF